MLCNNSVSSSRQEQILHLSISFIGDLQNFRNKTTLLPKILAVRVKCLKNTSWSTILVYVLALAKTATQPLLFPKTKAWQTQNLQFIFNFVRKQQKTRAAHFLQHSSIWALWWKVGYVAPSGKTRRKNLGVNFHQASAKQNLNVTRNHTVIAYNCNKHRTSKEHS